MVSLSAIAGFALVSLLLAASPGPSWAYVISSTAAQGRTGGFFAVAGNGLGIAIHVVAVALGLSAMIALASITFAVLKILGGAYLIWLGVQAIRRSWQPTTSTSDTPCGTPWQLFRGGVLTNVLNPKVAAVMLAVLPHWVDPSIGPPAAQFLLLGSFHVVIASSLLLVLSMLTLVAQHRLDAPPRWLGVVTGVALVIFGVKLAWW